MNSAAMDDSLAAARVHFYYDIFLVALFKPPVQHLSLNIPQILIFFLFTFRQESEDLSR